ncbi:unnamed protein product [Lupinus luteus]|uniref:Uncharacterized protein n=1 Tax=Lupinus luteus TaxID=3873 RepID=A0AAV1Y7H1_LUPLU
MKYLFPAKDGVSNGPHTSECTTSSTPLDLIATSDLNGFLVCLPIKQTSHTFSGNVVIGIPLTICFEPN